MKLPKKLNKFDLSFIGFVILYILLGLAMYLYFSTRAEPVKINPLVNSALPESESQDFKFLVFGDSGVGSNEQKQIAALLGAQKPDLMIHTGDLAYQRGSYSDIQSNVIDIYGELLSQAAFYPSLGNHDYGTSRGAPFVNTFDLPGNERYYSLEYKDTTFVALDTNDPLDQNPAIMLSWLEETLARVETTWVIVYFHHPPYSSGAHGSDRRVQEKIVTLLEKYKVDFVFSGHDHNYQRTCSIKASSCQSDGIYYIVTGGGGAPLYRVGDPQWFTAKQISAYHFILAEKKDCTLEYKVISITSEQLDSFSKSKCN